MAEQRLDDVAAVVACHGGSGTVFGTLAVESGGAREFWPAACEAWGLDDVVPLREAARRARFG